MVSMIPHRRSQGSPPRVRGKVVLSSENPLCRGITPAYAGKRASQLCAGLAPRDHPRVCGEKAYSLVMSGSLWGSPPRMRGKVPQPGVEGCRLGITPACAGKRRTGPAVRDRSWDHPRVCGEKNACWGVPQTPLGSPPRMRGKDVRGRYQENKSGITPAYAGKRRSAAKVPKSEWDHPRVCGEKSNSHQFIANLYGSPPRMRGKDTEPHAERNPDGITPAYAGKS